MSSSQGQSLVNRLFDDQARRWDDLYAEDGLTARIIQHRLALSLRWVDQLRLPAGSPVLEVGCGAGRLAAALAERGLSVTALDASDRMVELTRERARTGGWPRLVAMPGDVQRLGFPNRSFELVTALGVLDWVPSPERAMEQMARVLRPGGRLIFSCGHPGALAYFLEPFWNPFLAPAMRVIKGVLELVRLRERKAGARQRMYSLRFQNGLVNRVGLARVESRTVGFGPFTAAWVRVLPEGLGIRINGALQRLADRNLPIVRRAGMGYLVLARSLGR